MPGRTLLVYSLTPLLGSLLLIPVPASNDLPSEEVPAEKKVEPAFLVDPYLQLPTTTRFGSSLVSFKSATARCEAA